MKICEAFLVEYSRPLNALDQGEWSWEYLQHDLEYLDFKGLRMFFKDGSSIKLKEQKR
jgi:hypothetical protein